MRCIGLFCPWSRLIRIQSYWTMSFWTWSRTDPASIQHPFINGNNPIEAYPRKEIPHQVRDDVRGETLWVWLSCTVLLHQDIARNDLNPIPFETDSYIRPKKEAVSKKNLTHLLKGGKWGQPPKMTVKAPCYPFTSSSTRTGFGSDLRMSSSSMMFVAPAYLSITNST